MKTIFNPLPIVLLVLEGIAAWLGVSLTPWAFLAMPAIFVGVWCSAPNFNLANGCLAWIVILAGAILSGFHPLSGAAIYLGAGCAWFIGSGTLALYIRLRRGRYEG